MRGSIFRTTDLGVNLIHGSKVRHISEVDVGLHNVLQAGSGRFQHLGYILQCCFLSRRRKKNNSVRDDRGKKEQNKRSFVQFEPAHRLLRAIADQECIRCFLRRRRFPSKSLLGSTQAREEQHRVHERLAALLSGSERCPQSQ